MVAYLGNGEVIGELALLTGSPRSATVRSPEHAVLFAVDKAVFLDLMDVLPAFSRNLSRGARRASRGDDAQGATRLRQAAAGQPALLRPRDRDPDADRLAADRSPGRRAGQAQAGRALLLPGQHRTRPLPPPDRRRRRVPAVPEHDRGRLLVHRPRGERGGGADRDLDARDLAAHGIGADAGRAADAEGAAAARRPRVPAEGAPARVGGGRVDRARRLGLVAAQEGRDARRPAARRCRARPTRSTARSRPSWNPAR